MSSSNHVQVHAIWLAQDDPKKNTAVRLSRRGDIEPVSYTHLTLPTKA